jgi:hypothetical protein
MGSERMAALVENFGPERLIVDSARLGRVGPAMVAKTARLMAQRGVSAEVIHQVVYTTRWPLWIERRNGRAALFAPAAIDQRTLYEALVLRRPDTADRATGRHVTIYGFRQSAAPLNN